MKMKAIQHKFGQTLHENNIHIVVRIQYATYQSMLEYLDLSNKRKQCNVNLLPL
jgi:hypothetical protein